MIVILSISGCRNNCQELCEEMAAFAEEECNNTFPEQQVDQCLADYDKEKIDEKQDAVCEDTLPTLREEWTCEEIEDYFAGGGGGAADDANTTE
ncbi:MAG: hypothetical protein CL927_10160 [Deltaproteobacteria bacterium]|nr:hypothetical protein [Deltaproteobacteria bacterium]HCH62990.1 hypothetical protein [Deltaproteobacteria bacterium]